MQKLKMEMMNNGKAYKQHESATSGTYADYGKVWYNNFVLH